MLFGSSRQKPRSPFGMDGIVAGDGTMPTIPGGPPPALMGRPGLGMSAQAAPKKGKVNWGGVAADFLAGLAGREGPYLAMLEHQRKIEAEEQQYQRRRQAELEDYEAKKGIDARFPQAVNNDTVNDYQFIERTLGKAAADQYLRNLGDPMTTLTLPGNRVYSGPRSGIGAALGGGGAPPGPKPGHVEDGHEFIGGDPANPQSWRPVGGAATPASRPFAGSGFVPPVRLKHGQMTSGRRTPEGNRIVGGVPGSGHLRGTDADYDGPDLNALLQEVRGLPGHEKSFIHRGHVHGRGKWNVPYFGKNGTKGLKR